MDLKRLDDFFRPEEIEWKLVKTFGDKMQGIMAPYVTARAVRKRLDDVCGKENWKDSYAPWKNNSQICRLSIRCGDEWVTKEDGADDTAIDGTKGGISDSFKRAAVKWGIGAYLYELPTMWAPLDAYKDKKGNIKYAIQKTFVPQIPKEFLPSGVAEEGQKARVIDENAGLSDLLQDLNHPISEEQLKEVMDIIVKYHLSMDKLLFHYKIERVEDMTEQQYLGYIDTLKQHIPGFQQPSAHKKPLQSEKEQAQLENINKALGATE